MPSMTELTENRWLKPLALASVAVLALSACGDDEENGDAEAETEVETDVEIDAEVETLEEGVLQVCADVPYPPFEYYDTEGNVVGYDIDIAAAIAGALGLELELIESSWEGLESGLALESENCDLVISGMSITEERAGNMLFSDPYLDDNLGLLATTDSGISSTDDLDGVPVGVQNGTTGHTYAAEELGLDVTEYEDSGLLLQGLEAGQVEALIGNISIIGYQTGDDAAYEFVEEIDTGEQLGIAAHLENQELIEAVNEVLAALDAEGTLEEIREAWFHSETPDEGADPEDEGDEDVDDGAEDEN
ncbi:ABC transporter substrate-binding protein [Nesterenkonia alkaliphila]|uniref:Transporter substrate-binding domain-containing protein n=1 Tax=Nesterenkonia alkaliphila TaxID=1463631 RepID=A0A7K1ULE4_9MICC|nr:ABC transporter substrate-binding protein [Nesterenkonia alkaliphila]MVT27244.1 transporter substrate-binding domain-containing protein [Nesterenkonia alkaliphila]GFZ78344.1 basic amino acid ABC transporter substrate-binding protein [Nesterenkonia alkaliphila]